MAEQPLVCAAPAKINLYLHIIGRRADGFHNLDSLVAFAGVHDTLTFLPADDLELSIDGPFAAPLREGNDNLVLRAARVLAEAAGIDARASITLTKRLPVASGMGGGSADAAAALKGLCRLWKLNPAADVVREIARVLGSDVSMCLNGKAAFIGGVGHEITPAPALPASFIVLVNPGAGLSTPAVFAARQGNFTGPGRFDYDPADAAELAAILASRENGLTVPALGLLPAIGDVLQALADTDGVLLSRMTGSGATCFGLYAQADKAATAALTLGLAHPDWWVKAASLEGDTGAMDRFDQAQ